MPYQGLIFAAVLGVGLAVAIGMFIAGTQWEEPQTYGEETRRRREGYNHRRPGGYNRRESKNYEQTTCPICRDSLSDPLQIRTLCCKHKYHSICIQRWFAEQTANGGSLWCPVCREHQRM